MKRLILRWIIGGFVDWLLNVAKMKQHYWPGDRVRQLNSEFTHGEGWVLTPSWRGDGWYRVKFDQGSNYYVHFSDLQGLYVDEKDIPEDLRKIRDLLRERV